MLENFNYYSAIVTVLKKEIKAVNEYKVGKEKAFNYLYGKVSGIPWSAYKLDDGRPVTLGNKMSPKDIKRLIDHIIQEIDYV